MPDDKAKEISQAIILLQCHGYTVVAPWYKTEALTPVKALRYLIDAEKRERRRKERVERFKRWLNRITPKWRSDHA